MNQMVLLFFMLFSVLDLVMDSQHLTDCCDQNSKIVFQEQSKILDMGIIGPEGHPLSRPEEVNVHRSLSQLRD